LRISKDGTKFTLKLERYDIIEEAVKVINEHTITLPEKISADIIKFVQARSFSASHCYIAEEKADEHVRGLISEAMIIYRNDDANNNNTFGFDIRNLWNLSEVLYEKAVDNK
jgi:hypothetical protein